MLSIRTILCGALVAMGALASPKTNAAPVAWSNSSGSSTDFTWTNGANDNGLANDPVTTGSTFTFFPSLKAFTINSAPGTANEVIRVTLVPNAGQRISGISADFFGDATVLGTGAAGYDATFDAQKHGTGTHVSKMLAPADITDQGAIADHLDLLVPDGFGKVDLSLALNLHATGDNAFSELKVVKFNVQTAPANVVPLPAAIVMAPAGAAVAAFAKRRMTKRA